MIYCSNIWFKAEITSTDILNLVAKWLKKKTVGLRGGPINLFKIKPGKSYLLAGHRVERERTEDNEYPYLESVKYIHKDGVINGRRWITEIGLRQEAKHKDIQVSILLDYEDVSSGFENPIPTRPQIIPELIRSFRSSISTTTIGHKIEVLDDDERATWFWWDIERPDRRHPLIVISPTTGGDYLIDPGRLMSQLIGIAQVVQIPPGADTFEIEKEIGRNYIVYNGAINIILPEFRGSSRSLKILPEEINQWVLEPDDYSIKDLFSRITYHTNLPNSWLHISPELVKDEKRTRKLAEYKKEAERTGDTAEYIRLLEDEDLSLRQKVKTTEEFYEKLFSEKEDEIAKLKFDIDSLKMKLNQANVAKYEINGNGSQDALRQSLYSAFVTDSPNLIDALMTIQYLYPDNVQILDEAWSSAEKVVNFKNGVKSLDLLQKLVNEYRAALINGKGDTEARSVFGKDNFAAKESESVGKNKSARQVRTFHYDGEDVVMEKHLRVGVKESDAETVRIHFHWDVKAKKIIIGHCGPHLKQR